MSGISNTPSAIINALDKYEKAFHDSDSAVLWDWEALQSESTLPNKSADVDLKHVLTEESAKSDAFKQAVEPVLNRMTRSTN